MYKIVEPYALLFQTLQVRSEPVARVVINGVDTGRDSPLMGLRLPVGLHEVVFIDTARGYKRAYTVRIMPEMITNLSVDLR